MTPPRLVPIAGGNGTAFLHECQVCGAPNAAFGEGVALRKGAPGRWFCFAHWQGEVRKKAKAIGGDLFGEAEE